MTLPAKINIGSLETFIWSIMFKILWFLKVVHSKNISFQNIKHRYSSWSDKAFTCAVIFVWRGIWNYANCTFKSELGTLEWINFNLDFLTRISTVETFHFSPNPLFFSRSLDIRKLFSPKRIFLFSHWLPAFLWLAATVSQMIKY